MIPTLRSRLARHGLRLEAAWEDLAGAPRRRSSRSSRHDGRWNESLMARSIPTSPLRRKT